LSPEPITKTLSFILAGAGIIFTEESFLNFSFASGDLINNLTGKSIGIPITARGQIISRFDDPTLAGNVYDGVKLSTQLAQPSPTGALGVANSVNTALDVGESLHNSGSQIINGIQ